MRLLSLSKKSNDQSSLGCLCPNGIILPTQVHVSGNARAMFDALIDRHYLTPLLTVVHASDALPQQLNALHIAGGGLGLTSVSEQRVDYGLTLLNHFKRVERKRLGIVGRTLSGGANMFETLLATSHKGMLHAVIDDIDLFLKECGGLEADFRAHYRGTFVPEHWGTTQAEFRELVKDHIRRHLLNIDALITKNIKKLITRPHTTDSNQGEFAPFSSLANLWKALNNR